MRVSFFSFFSSCYSVPRVIDQDLERYEPLEEEDHQGVRVPFKLEETYDQSFRANNFNGTWKTDREILYSDNYVGDIRLFDVTTGSSTVLLDSSVTVRFNNLFRPANYRVHIYIRNVKRWKGSKFFISILLRRSSRGRIEKKFTRKTMIIYIGRDKLQVSISRTNCRNVLPIGDTYE